MLAYQHADGETIMQSLKALSIILKIRRFIKTKDKSIIEKIVENAPPEVREKVLRIADQYIKAKNGEISTIQAVKNIAKELGLESYTDMADLAEEILDLIKEIVSEEKGE